MPYPSVAVNAVKLAVGNHMAYKLAMTLNTIALHDAFVPAMNPDGLMKILQREGGRVK
jgi:hypothetical protein